MKSDSVDKIVENYFSAVAAVPFTYKGTRYPVATLRISPLLLRGYTCPAGCGGCCPSFTLDYLPDERRPEQAQPRLVTFDGRSVVVHTIAPVASPDNRCQMLDRSNGRCSIHGHHPFSCDFELIRTLHRRDRAEVTLTTQLFGRGWAMHRTDGGTGAACSIVPASSASAADVERKLRRLQQWATYFSLPTRLPAVLTWVRENRHDPDAARALVLPGREDPSP